MSVGCMGEGANISRHFDHTTVYTYTTVQQFMYLGFMTLQWYRGRLYTYILVFSFVATYYAACGVRHKPRDPVLFQYADNLHRDN